MSNMKENHFLRGLILEHIDMEKRDQCKHELRVKLKHYEEDYAKGQEIFESL